MSFKFIGFAFVLMALSCVDSRSVESKGTIKKRESLYVFKDQIDSSLNRYGSNVFRQGQLNTPKIPFPEQEQQTDVKHNLDTSLYDVIEGDIVVRKRDQLRQKRKIINEINSYTGGRTRWPNKVVPYEMDRSMSGGMVKRIEDAITNWQSNTCIRFEPYDRIRHAGYKSRVVFQPSNICGSNVGYSEDQPITINTVYLGTDCSTGTIIHELGHVIGFYHEHSRIDRDLHITLNWNAINKQGLQAQYVKMPDPQPGYYGVPYDLFSIMHYSTFGGTLLATDPKRTFLMGQRLGLSFLDIKLANLAYKCAESCSPQIKCQNEGFVDANCKCVCPDSFTGVSCEVLINAGSNNLNTVSIDNLNLNCDFQSKSLCSWTQDRYRATNDWEFNKPEYAGYTDTQVFFSKFDPNFKTGPQTGRHNGDKTGSYLYLNSKMKKVANANAIITTPTISLNKDFNGCLEFWYQMFKGDIDNKNYPIKLGNLSVIVQDSTGSRTSIWSVSNNQGQQWKLAQVNVVLKAPLSAIAIQAQLVGVFYGDIAIDDIKLRSQSCQLRRPNLQIVKSSQPKWTQWSSCSVTCGTGIKTRTKVNCTGTDSECQQVLPCNMTDCKDIWSEWNDWSKCSTTCGKGYQYRVRECKSQSVSECKGGTNEYRNCVLGDCVNSTANSTNTVANTTVRTVREFNSQTVLLDQDTNCGGVYTLSQLPGNKVTIQSPNYPQQYDSNLRCNYLLLSPKNTNITVRLIDVDLEESTRDTCIDGLELRYYSYGQPGPIYCGRSSSTLSSAPMQTTSYSNFVLLIFRSNWGQTKQRRGFMFEATYA